MSEPQLTKKQKEQVAQRAKGCCEYCRSQLSFSPDPFSIEHILPRSKGGTDDTENLALSCQGCNGHKQIHINAYDPVTGSLVALYNPRTQLWKDHFTWNEAFTLMIGLTATGRATIERLQLNREGVANLRQALRAFNKHPPASL
jgi:HNH endonuclease